MRISPSAYLDHHRCPRKWWFKKVDGQVEPPKDHLTLGTLVHSYQERYLLSRIHPTDRPRDVFDTLMEEDARFASQMEHYSEPFTIVFKASRVAGLAVDNGNYAHALEGSDLRVELRVQGTCGPLPYIGFSDYVYERDGLLCIGDHKTSSNPNGQYTYPKKGDIELDPQMLFYGYTVAQEVGYKGPISLEHSYIPTRGRQTRIHRGIAEWSHAEENWGRFVETAGKMKDLGSVTEAKDVAANLSACSMFGGCPFKSICPSHKPKFSIEDVTMDEAKLAEIKARIAARKAAKAAPTSDLTDNVWPVGERPDVGVNYTSAGEEFMVMGFTKRGGNIKLRIAGANEAMSRADFEAYYGGGVPDEPAKLTTIRPPNAKEFVPSEKFEAAVEEEAEAQLKSPKAIAEEILEHLLSTGLDPAKPYDAHSDNVVRDLVLNGLGEKRRSKKSRRGILQTGAAMGLWTVGEGDAIKGWGAQEELKEVLAADTQAAITEIEAAPAGIAEGVTAGEEPAAESGDRDRRAGEELPPPVQPPVVETSTVLVDATCYSAVPLDNWMVFHNVEGRYQALAAEDQELRGMPYYAAPFGKGKPAMTMVLVDAIRKGVLKLPPYLEIPSSHPLAPTLVPALAEFHVLVVKGMR